MKKQYRNFNFTLVISGAHEDTCGLDDAIFEAGCDDAILYFKNGVTYLEFDREATSLKNAIVSAIHQVGSTPFGLTIVRVEPDDLVSASEIARRTAKSREAIRKLIDLHTKLHDFPAPILVLNDRNTLWSWAKVANWLLSKNKLSDYSIIEDALFIRNLNSAIEIHDNELMCFDTTKSSHCKNNTFDFFTNLFTPNSCIPSKPSILLPVFVRDYNMARELPKWTSI